MEEQLAGFWGAVVGLISSSRLLNLPDYYY